MEERTAGIDLASEEHRLVVVEASGRRLEERRYSHSEEEITALVRRLLALAVCRVALERPNGLVVDRLLDAGISVVAVHPNQLAASRDRYRSGGGKSDVGFSRPRRNTSSRRAGSSGGRPGKRRRYVHFLAMSSRCQRNSVCGETTNTDQRSRRSSLLAAASSIRSRHPSGGRFTVRPNTAS
jgi:Transposase